MDPIAILALLSLLSAAHCKPFVAGEWAYGKVVGYHKRSGHFSGSVCVEIMTPFPSCGWRIQLLFDVELRYTPVVPQGVFAKMLYTMDWFEYVNRPDNGDLRNTTSSCLNVTLKAETDSNKRPHFEARMSCVCNEAKRPI
ncbi:hypothetical protein V1264_003425 [Littorina saxatilis]|uniref:Uncharacterized protein n=1 Tax=Littorina saxatilis TaxID=31220 RepID=A0AAN9G899_9CAEN